MHFKQYFQGFQPLDIHVIQENNYETNNLRVALCLAGCEDR
mgnify:CR=1 FL=1